MITRLKIKNFKSFLDAELKLGPLTVLIGTNASGKSNLRDALRFLHGVGRGYSLPEIVGEKWGEAGYLEWPGIRGGFKELTFNGTLAENVLLDLIQVPLLENNTVLNNFIEIDMKNKVYRYKIDCNKDYSFRNEYIYNVERSKLPSDQSEYWIKSIAKSVFQEYKKLEVQKLSSKKLDQVYEERSDYVYFKLIVSSFRFFDLSPYEMKRPSLPGQTKLTDRGENLSSVLYSICKEQSGKELLLEWLSELTPQDVVDLEFIEDYQGRILVHLVEKGGNKISAYSASDGTLRFLGMLAALFSPKPGKIYFFEEIENGIHPTCLHLLVQLLEQRAKATGIQIIVSTHSPLILDYLSEESLEYASLIHRNDAKLGSKIIPLTQIENFGDVKSIERLSGLHAEGWFETIMSLLEEGEDEL
ncbi:MAG: AAA family ATPase [Halanaerobiales bacterium]|nr:AAA family ATPase [Halanaerobiales bacterium]